MPPTVYSVLLKICDINHPKQKKTSITGVSAEGGGSVSKLTASLSVSVVHLKLL